MAFQMKVIEFTPVSAFTTLLNLIRIEPNSSFKLTFKSANRISTQMNHAEWAMSYLMEPFVRSFVCSDTAFTGLNSMASLTLMS